MADLTANATKIMELVEGLTIVELADLVSAMEEKFGVSAAAPVAVAAAGGASADADEKTSFNVVMTSAGGQKIAVIKVVKEVLSLGLKEAKDMVDAAPSVVKENMKKEDAEALKAKLEEAGAKVTLK